MIRVWFSTILALSFCAVIGLVVLLALPRNSPSIIRAPSPIPSITQPDTADPEPVKTVSSPSSLYTYELFPDNAGSCTFGIRNSSGGAIDLSFLPGGPVTECEVIEGNWNSRFHSWLSDTSFLIVTPDGEFQRIHFLEKTITKPVPAFDTDTYSLVLMNGKETRFLLRENNYRSDHPEQNTNAYSVFDQTGMRISQTILSKAYPGEMFYDPNNEGFVFVDMTWSDQFTLNEIVVRRYDIATNSTRDIYRTSKEFVHKGGCLVGTLASDQKSITFSNSQTENGCFRGDPLYKNNALTIAF